MTKRKGGRRGLAALPPDKVRKIASLGGKMAQRLGRAHKWTREEAKLQRRLQLEKQREQEEMLLRLRARLRAQLGPSPGPPSKTSVDEP